MTDLFLRLTRRDGSKCLVNTNHIVAVFPEGSGAVVSTCMDSTDDRALRVKEGFDAIAMRLDVQDA